MKIKRITKITLPEEKQFYDVIEANPYHNFLIKTTGEHSIVSHNCNFTDEINFSLTSNIVKAKEKAKKMITQIDARQRSRFLRGEYLPTINIIASSKDSEQSFLEDYIKNKKENESKTTLIVDEPQWIVDSRKDSPKKFWVAIGNKFLANDLLPVDADEAMVDLYRAKGYNMLHVPIGYLETFQQNLEEAICSIAGIATASSLKYISGTRWNEIKTDSYRNPFTKEILEIGNNPSDHYQYSNFFDLDAIDRNHIGDPLFIHLDMSTTGDKTGIAGVWIIGKKPKAKLLTTSDPQFKPEEVLNTEDNNSDASNELQYKLAFHVAIKAPKGYQISFEKHRTFIRWLREKGFNIKGITSDTFQSAQLQQQLSADGFKVDILSVDRLDSQTKQCLPYVFFKSAIYEQDLIVYKKCDLLTEEIAGLEREADGHIQHPDNGRFGCFTGDTLVSLTDGRKLSFLELIEEQKQGKQNYVYSMDLTSGNIESKPIKKVWMTYKDQPLVKLTLDDGSEIKCTLNHRFMLRNGSYIEAKDLLPDDSLMPLYTKYPESGPLKAYRMIYSPFEDTWHYEHRWFAKEVLDEKHLVHHKDCNKNNNNENNLVWVSKAKHLQIHKEMQTGSCAPDVVARRTKSLLDWYQNPEYESIREERNQKISNTLIDKNGRAHHDELIEQRAQQHQRGIERRAYSESLREQERMHIKEIEDTFNIKWDELSTNEKDSYAVKLARLNNPEIQNKISKAISENHAAGKYVNAKKALSECNEKTKMLKKLFPTIDLNKFEELFGFRYESLRATQRAPWTNRYRAKMYSLLNHSIVKVEFISDRADVYDLEVPDNHNFALGCGVFVHNSKDCADSLCGALFNASKFAEEFEYSYGQKETLEQTLLLNEDYNDDMRQLTLDLEEELKRLGPSLNSKRIPTHPSNVNNSTADYSLYNDDIIIL